MSRWFEYVNERLNSMANETDKSKIEDFDWPTDEVIQAARIRIVELLRDTTPTPSVVPAVWDDEDGEILHERGGVEFCWHRNNWGIELVVSLDEERLWARHRDGTQQIYWEGLDDLAGEAMLDWRFLLDELERE